MVEFGADALANLRLWREWFRGLWEGKGSFERAGERMYGLS